MTTTKAAPVPTAPATKKTKARKWGQKRLGIPEDRFFLEFNTAAGIGIVGLFILLAINLSSGTPNSTAAIGYRTSAPIAIGVITLILVFWPALRSVQEREWKRLIALVALIPIAPLVTSFIMYVASGSLQKSAQAGLMDNFGSNLFMAVLCGVALILNGWLVFRIGATSSTNPEIETAKKAMQDAQSEHDKAQKRAKRHARKQVTAQEDVDTWTTEHDSAAAKLEKASRKYSKAKMKNDAAEAEATKEATAQLQELKATLKDQPKGQAREDAKSDLAAPIATAKANLELAKSKHESSTVAKRLLKATKNRDNASELEISTREELRVASDKLKRRGRKVTSSGKDCAKVASELDAAQTGFITVKSKRDKNVGKLVWTLALLFLGTALCYTFGWYAFVMMAVYPHIPL